jgi:hypothetical protein
MPIQLTRQALYDRVWETPLKYLAQEFETDPVRLSECCRAHAIPTPGHGYWTLRQMGRSVEKTPLGPAPDGLADLVEIAPRPVRVRKAVLPKAAPPDVVVEAATTTVIPSDLTIASDPAPVLTGSGQPTPSEEAVALHRLAQKTVEKLAKAKAGELAQIKGRGFFTVTATPAQAERIGQVLSQLVAAVDAQSWRVPSGEGGIRLEPDGEALGFSITEQTDKVKHEPTEAEQAALRRHEEAKQRAQRLGKWFSDWDRPKIPEWDWIPNGQLVLTMDMGLYRSDRIRRKFSDGKTQRLEGMIEPMIEALATYAASEKAGRIRREQERLESIEREKRWQEAKRKAELDTKRYEFLQAQVKRLGRLREVEAVIDVIRTQGPAEGAVAAFVDWADDFAEASVGCRMKRKAKRLSGDHLANRADKVTVRGEFAARIGTLKHLHRLVNCSYGRRQCYLASGIRGRRIFFDHGSTIAASNTSSSWIVVPTCSGQASRYTPFASAFARWRRPRGAVRPRRNGPGTNMGLARSVAVPSRLIPGVSMLHKTLPLAALLAAVAVCGAAQADETDPARGDRNPAGDKAPIMEKAFGSTIVSTYPDGRQGELWLNKDGTYTAAGRRQDRSSGAWQVKGDKLCMKQKTPFPAPFSFCTPIPAAGIEKSWTGKAYTGEPISIRLVKGMHGRDAKASKGAVAGKSNDQG